MGRGGCDSYDVHECTTVAIVCVDFDYWAKTEDDKMLTLAWDESF